MIKINNYNEVIRINSFNESVESLKYSYSNWRENSQAMKLIKKSLSDVKEKYNLIEDKSKVNLTQLNQLEKELKMEETK